MKPAQLPWEPKKPRLPGCEIPRLFRVAGPSELCTPETSASWFNLAAPVDFPNVSELDGSHCESETSHFPGVVLPLSIQISFCTKVHYVSNGLSTKKYGSIACCSFRGARPQHVPARSAVTVQHVHQICCGFCNLWLCRRPGWGWWHHNLPLQLILGKCFWVQAVCTLLGFSVLIYF